MIVLRKLISQKMPGICILLLIQVKKDKAICNEIMGQMDLQLLKHFNGLALGGGEKQQAQFARILAKIWERTKKVPGIYLLMNPLPVPAFISCTRFCKHQKNLPREKIIVMAVLFDANLAIQYGDSIILMEERK